MTDTTPHVDRRVIAPRFTRFGAWLLDILVCAMLVSGVQRVFPFFWDEPANLVPAFAYLCAAHACFGRTLGKWVVGLKVVGRGTDRPPSPWAAALRSLWVFLPLIPVVGQFLAVADWLWSFFDEEKRCLHDRLAGTLVVNARVKD
ncbi:hypothetical protein GCM10009850_105310 [Nonomuraea monospora]|uniref:RDD domain-containing protein n=1 Tax=Nonomuraea monospora TaxID=568818 RepID=A0ABP5PTZ6_9ACTN